MSNARSSYSAESGKERDMCRILIIEDDREMNQGISYVLEKDGYRTASVHSIAEGKNAFEEQGADLILLDVNLPDGEGFVFCRWVRERSRVPVLFLTARDLEEDALKGYVILKRDREKEKIAFDDGFLQIDLDKAQIRREGELCTVTPTEFRILKEFLMHKGQLLTYEILLDRLWDGGNQFVDKHALAVNMNRLRGKIEDEEHKYISNVYGMGYQWIGK